MSSVAWRVTSSSPTQQVRERPGRIQLEPSGKIDQGIPERALGRLQLAEAALESIADEPGRLADPELLRDVRAMRLGGLDADAEQLRDLPGPLALRDELQHLALPLAEGVGGEGGPGPEGIHQRSRHARAQVDAARDDVPDGPNQVL